MYNNTLTSYFPQIFIISLFSYRMVLSFVTSIQSDFFLLVCLFSVVWLSVIHNKDLLATIHLLVAMVKHFQAELNLPLNVKVEVVVVEVSCCTQSVKKRKKLKKSMRCCDKLQFSGQSKWHQIRSADRGPNRRQVSSFLSLVILWRWEMLTPLSSSAATQAPTPLPIRKVSEAGHRLNWHDILNVIQTLLKLTNTFFCHLITQRKIPLSNCWSLRLTRSTQWRRYNKGSSNAEELRLIKVLDALVNYFRW